MATHAGAHGRIHDDEDPVGADTPRAVIPEPLGPGPAPEPAPPSPPPEPAPPPPSPLPEPAAGQVHRFGFRFAGPFRLAAMAFRVDPGRAHVRVDSGPGGRLEVRYGPWCVETAVGNVAGVEVTGPYAVLKTIGPPHLSLADRGLTFASNRDRGVCIRFHEPVRGIDALGVIRHPGLTVTVDDVDGLATVLAGALAGP